MIAEHMGDKFIFRNEKSKPKLRLASISVTYISEGRGDVAFKTDELASNKQGSKLRVTSNRIKGGSIIAESILTYETM